MTPISEIKSKISKLLELSSSNNEHEANTALLKAQELLSKHKLSIKDIQIPESDITVQIHQYTFRHKKWRMLLASIISSNFSCYCLIQPRHCGTKCIVFLGLKDDVDVCMEVYKYATSFILKRSTELKKEYKRHNQSTRDLEDSYATGFAAGLHQNYKEQKSSNSSVALAMIPDTKVTEAYNKVASIKTENIRPKINRSHQLVFMEGRIDGLTFSTSDKLEEPCNT